MEGHPRLPSRDDTDRCLNPGAGLDLNVDDFGDEVDELPLRAGWCRLCDGVRLVGVLILHRCGQHQLHDFAIPQGLDVIYHVEVVAEERSASAVSGRDVHEAAAFDVFGLCDPCIVVR